MTKPDDLPGTAHGKGRRIQVTLTNDEARALRAYRIEHGHASDAAAGAALIRQGLRYRLAPTTPTPSDLRE
jgi:hypothetical protein